ncbi:MAG: hypothetical protein ABFS23_04220 [Pseudomonadota bacterium]
MKPYLLFTAQAAATVDAGLQAFPSDLSLRGLGVDLALSRSDTKRASAYLAGLPPRLVRLPQWAFRQGLLACEAGRTEEAANWFRSLDRESDGTGKRRAGTWKVPRETVARLSAEPVPEGCREVAAGMLGGLQP